MSIHLVSDDLIDSGATLYATEHDYASIEQAYERGAKSLRDIYEAELQSMRERLSRMEEAGNAMSAHPPASTEPRLTVDGLANEIRTVDGSNSLGAGALAEALMPYLTKAAKP